MAQKTRSQLVAESVGTFADTPVGNITPPNHRAFNANCIDSFANLSDSNTFTQTNTFNGPVIGNDRVETNYGTVAAAGTMNIGSAVDANTLLVTGAAVITSFGSSAGIGNWRFLIFEGVCTLTHSASIQCPTSNDIETNGGDRCLVVCVASGEWMVHTYQRENGIPLVSTPNPVTYSSTLPVNTDDSTGGYQKGYRWIYQSGPDYQEFICTDNAIGGALWLPVAGTFGSGSGLETLQIAGINSTFHPNSGGILDIITQLKYNIISDLIMVEGYIEVSPVDINNAHPDGGIEIDLSSNNFNLNLDTNATLTFGSGFGTVQWNNQAGAAGYSCVAYTDAAQSLAILVKTTNPHFGTNGGIRIYVTLGFGFTLN